MAGGRRAGNVRQEYMFPSVLALLVYGAMGLAAGVLGVRSTRAEFTIHLWSIYLPDVLLVTACVFSGLVAVHAAALSVASRPRLSTSARAAAALAAFSCAAALLHTSAARIPAGIVAVGAFVIALP